VSRKVPELRNLAVDPVQFSTVRLRQMCCDVWMILLVSRYRLLALIVCLGYCLNPSLEARALIPGS
jgi:hypothetical protein